MRNKDEVIKEWWISYEYGDSERFLDFAEGLNINEFVKEDGERVVWLEDGNHYIAHGQRIGEFDNDMAKDIMDWLEDCGVDFLERGGDVRGNSDDL